METRRRLSDANLEIMKAVWRKGGEVTINDIFEAINAGRSNKVKRATVQVQMRRLESYGWLTHRVRDREFIYSALRNEADVMRGMLNHLRDRLFEGSTADLAKCLFEDESLTPADLKRIRAILDRNKKE